MPSLGWALIGVLAVRPGPKPTSPVGELNKGFYVTAVLAAISMVIVCYWMLP